MFKTPRDVPFSCSCGTIKGTLRGASPRTGTHAVCHCIDCRAAELYEGNEVPQTVSLFQTSPDRISFEQGQDQIGVFSFGEKNILRWYATCCGSILCNTLRNPKIAFTSIRISLLSVDDADVVGPVVAQAFIPTPSGKPRHSGLPRFIWQAFGRIAGARISGKWRDNPLFDTETLEPITPVQIVPAIERRALLERLR